MSARRRFRLVILSLLWAGPGWTAGATAQTVDGRVVDTATEEAVPGVEVILRDEREAVVARAESDEEGAFLLVVRHPGTYLIEAHRLGYAPLSPETLELERDAVEVEVRLSRSPIEMEAISVTGRRVDPRHEASLDGARARYELLPGVGSRRVVLRTDAPFAAAMKVDDVLRWFPPASNCVILFQDGRLALSPDAVTDLWLDSSAEWWEAVEFYRRWGDAPQGLRGVPPYVRDPWFCSVIALWSREEGIPAQRTSTARRAALAGGFAAVAYVLGSLFMGR